MEFEKDKKKVETYPLWWMSRETCRRIHAGVAFYDEKFNEYRLKVDFLQAVMGVENAIFYVRPVAQVGERTYYRMEAIVKKNGKFHSRRLVGEGYASKDTKWEVHLDFGPVEKFLVLSLDAKKENTAMERIGSNDPAPRRSA